MCYFAGIEAHYQATAEEATGTLWQGDLFPEFDITNAMDRAEFPCITSAHPQEMRPYHWLFIPSWFEMASQFANIKIWGANMIIEEAEHKKPFARILGSQRSVMVLSHFFEWRHEGAQKIKHRIFLPSRRPLLMPGVYSKALIDGSEYYSCNVATMKAQGVMEYIHNTKKRQPVIVSPETARVWVDISIPFEDARSAVIEENLSRELEYTVG